MMINYFDLGLHTGIELEWIVDKIMPAAHVNALDYRVYGFEAHPTFVEMNKQKFAAQSNVEIVHGAIGRTTGTRRLYLAPNSVGHSIFATKNNVSKSFVEVEGIVFSQWLDKHVPTFRSDFNIIKVNIEGAEWELVNDLLEHDLFQYMHVLCGKWDDVEKVAELADNVKEYRDIFRREDLKVHRFSDWKPERNADMVDVITTAYKAYTPTK